jgi:hypothetical protein
MPAVSKKQEKFMQAVANNPKFAKKVGVKQSIGQEFTKEKGMKKVKKMMGGGMTAPGMTAPGMPGIRLVLKQWTPECKWQWKLKDNKRLWVA